MVNTSNTTDRTGSWAGAPSTVAADSASVHYLAGLLVERILAAKQSDGAICRHWDASEGARLVFPYEASFAAYALARAAGRLGRPALVDYAEEWCRWYQYHLFNEPGYGVDAAAGTPQSEHPTKVGGAWQNFYGTDAPFGGRKLSSGLVRDRLWEPSQNRYRLMDRTSQPGPPLDVTYFGSSPEKRAFRADGSDSYAAMYLVALHATWVAAGARREWLLATPALPVASGQSVPWPTLDPSPFAGSPGNIAVASTAQVSRLESVLRAVQVIGLTQKAGLCEALPRFATTANPSVPQWPGATNDAHRPIQLLMDNVEAAAGLAAAVAMASAASPAGVSSPPAWLAPTRAAILGDASDRLAYLYDAFDDAFWRQRSGTSYSQPANAVTDSTGSYVNLSADPVSYSPWGGSFGIVQAAQVWPALFSALSTPVSPHISALLVDRVARRWFPSNNIADSSNSFNTVADDNRVAVAAALTLSGRAFDGLTATRSWASRGAGVSWPSGQGFSVRTVALDLIGLLS